MKKEKGITLIALVITIIVLLILAGVTIATLTGDNGILTRANEAKEVTEEAGANEKVQMEVAGSFDEHGNFDMDKLKENLKENLGLQDSDIKDNGDGSITVTVDGYEILVDAEGSIKNPISVAEEEKKAIKMIVNSGDDGIVVLPVFEGTFIDWGDGEIQEIGKKERNYQELATTGNIQLAAVMTQGFKHQYAEKNKEYEVTIKGNIRIIDRKCMYIDNTYAEYQNKLIEITQWGETGLKTINLQNCINLRRIASPTENSFSNIENFDKAFDSCESLTSIPDDLFANCPNVISFEYTFNYCKSLTNIPDDLFANCPNVTSFEGTFSLCESLISIPENLFANCLKVTNFSYTFWACSNLTEKAIPLWERVENWETLNSEDIKEWNGKTPDGYGCYAECNKLNNYETIPVYWRHMQYEE